MRRTIPNELLGASNNLNLGRPWRYTVHNTVPIVAETLKAAGVYNPKRLFVVRARTCVGRRWARTPRTRPWR